MTFMACPSLSSSPRSSRAFVSPASDQARSYPFPDRLQSNTLSLGVGLTWTLYDGGEVDAAVASARIGKDQATVTESLKLRETELAQVQAMQSLRASMEQVRLYDKALEAAEKNVHTQQAEFENGLLTNLELMQALDTRLQIKRNRDQAEVNAKLAYVNAQLQLTGLPKSHSK